MILSIIIPIYKVEKYIIECLKSVEGQINDFVEVICVNDGTPDNSALIAEEYINGILLFKDKFKIVHQENKGLSSARNTGLMHASGRYVAFLDSDDKIHSNYIDVILDCIKSKSPDIIEFNMVRSNGDLLKTRVNKGNEKESCFRAVSWFACARVFNKNFLKEHKFLEGIFYEDMGFVPVLYVKTSNIIYIDQALYWYRINEQGITLNLSLENNNKTIESLSFLVVYYLELKNENSNNLYTVLAFQCYFILVMNAFVRFGWKKAMFFIGKYNFLFQDMKDSKIYMYLNIKMRIFLKFPSFYVFVYSLYRYMKK